MYNRKIRYESLLRSQLFFQLFKDFSHLFFRCSTRSGHREKMVQRHIASLVSGS